MPKVWPMRPENGTGFTGLSGLETSATFRMPPSCRFSHDIAPWESKIAARPSSAERGQLNHFILLRSNRVCV
jgi:hypothetical protein